MGMIGEFVFSLVGELFTPGPRTGMDPRAFYACGLRVVAGSHEGLGGSWRDGEAIVYPGGLDFEPFLHARDGLRAALSTAPPISVPVSAVVTARQRQPNDQEAGEIRADSQIVELTTKTATLEWAVPADRLERALKRVQASWPSEVSPA
jgi:hypothetical protein